MSKKLTETPLTTAKARAELRPGEYARQLADTESAIWYRKGKRGGVWFARWRNRGPGAAYRQKPVGSANDTSDIATDDGLLTFSQAEILARRIVKEARIAQKAAEAGPIQTVADAVRTYCASRDARDTKRAGRPVKSDARRRLSLHVIGSNARGKRAAVPPSALANVPLHDLRETDLRKWREGLPSQLKATTRQRLYNDLKAALNSAYSEKRESLPPGLPGIVKFGLRNIDDGEDHAPIARDNQILDDDQVKRIIAASRSVDADHGWDGDLFRLVLVLAATGARFSQVARMRVRDCQISAERLMVPVSRKGRGGKGAAHITIPIGRDVMHALASIVEDRPTDAVLLERWRRVQAPGGIEWRRDRRGPWQSSSELIRPWQAIRERAEMPQAIPYALRHSSIVRGIRANLPIRLVAAAHDTSVSMIERHYSRWIVDGLEQMARAAVVPLVAT